MTHITLDKPLMYTTTGRDTLVYTQIKFETYSTNGNLALVLTTDEGLDEDMIMLTVNLNAMFIEDNIVTIDINNPVVSSVLPDLIDNGILIDTEETAISSGFVDYPIIEVADVELVDQFMAETYG